MASLYFERARWYSITSQLTARDRHPILTKVIEGVGGEDNSTSSENGQAKVGEKTTLATSVIYEEAPLIEAQVCFEIYREGSERHDWVKTSD